MSEICVRPANLRSDTDELIGLFRRHLLTTFDYARFRWLYQEGVYGPARVWVSFERGTGRIVGSAAAYPRKLSFKGQEKWGLVLGDFCIDGKYRSLGPSVQLQRACLSALHEQPFEFAYDFPSQGMMAIYKRLGVEPCGNFLRWAKPLRAESKLRTVIRSDAVIRGLGFLANPFLTRRGWRGEESSCDLSLQQGPCSPEFSEFDHRILLGEEVRSMRTAEYLNWRYFGNPASSHEILTARQAGKLVGYVVISQEKDDARIVDLCSGNDPALVARLLFGAVQRLWSQGAATVSLNAGSTHPWNTIFERAGFRRRESTPMVVVMAPGSAISKMEFEHNWFVMQGDRDS